MEVILYITIISAIVVDIWLITKIIHKKQQVIKDLSIQILVGYAIIVPIFLTILYRFLSTDSLESVISFLGIGICSFINLILILVLINKSKSQKYALLIIINPLGLYVLTVLFSIIYHLLLN